jgi:kumamolisin
MTGANTPGGFFETPASLACVYKQVKVVVGCNPTVVTTVSAHGSRAIAIVDAYDDPNARNDLAAYSTEFGLPALTTEKFEVVYATPGGSTATSTPPPQDSSGRWETEESLDIEVAHAIAPKAKIFLVEANSSGSGNLFPAVVLASNLVAAAGGGEVTKSWGFGDFAGEDGFDGYFQTPNIVYFSSAGDAAGLNYPSTSPYVVSAGGSTINRNPTTGDYIAESAWPNTGGGATPNEPRPSYQDGIAALVGSSRGTPDMAFDADGRTAVWVYDTFPANGTAGIWYIVSGTCVASPGLAGLVNAAGSFAASANAELTTVYGDLGVNKDFPDIINGDCGAYAGFLNPVAPPFSRCPTRRDQEYPRKGRRCSPNPGRVRLFSAGGLLRRVDRLRRIGCADRRRICRRCKACECHGLKCRHAEQRLCRMGNLGRLRVQRYAIGFDCAASGGPTGAELERDVKSEVIALRTERDLSIIGIDDIVTAEAPARNETVGRITCGNPPARLVETDAKRRNRGIVV